MGMKVVLFPTLESAGRGSLRGATVVVIDVLRFSSTVIAALAAGASKIIPAPDVETALRLSGSSRNRSCLLAGEVNGKPIEGFDLFNSPPEFTPERVGGKRIIMSTSNGSRAAAEASKAARVLICAINNITAAAREIALLEEACILCSGSGGRIALEDLYCGGLVIEALGGLGVATELEDSGSAAVRIARSAGGETEGLLRATERGRELIEDGYENDIMFCSKIDSSGAVPEMRRGALELARAFRAGKRHVDEGRRSR
jgi:2-phosphosulfolactate phosphatase